ncbi:MAG: hypothetical protein GXP37_02155 [Chloroflexi bacterium]|nr:hypothetical protein [Chloroflexota bacterium]
MTKRFPVLLLLFLALLVLARPGIAQGPPISYPPETEVIRGVVEIRGTATHADFWKYELKAAPFGTQNWFDIITSETPVVDDVLARWDTQTVPDGTYTLRLRIVRRDGNYDEFRVQRLLVANSLPTDTPTPEVSPSPTTTPTPVPLTATPVILTPEIPTPTPAPTATPALAPAENTPFGGVGGSISTAELAQQAIDGSKKGVGIVLAVFLAVGIFFGVKNLLTWFYYRFLT